MPRHAGPPDDPTEASGTVGGASGHAGAHAASPPSFRPEPAEPPRGGGLLAWVRETAVILVSALVLSWLVKTFLVQAFFIPSQSMEDTLEVDDRILVSKLTPEVFDLDRGDVVVFSDPGGWLSGGTTTTETTFLGDVMTWIGLRPSDSDEHLVKRIIGLPGDEVACAGPGEPVTVNGVAIDETYLPAGTEPSEIAFDEVVPDGYLWVMGDNRQHSADSRYNLGSAGGGFVPISDVVGVAFVIVWPLDRFTLLHTPSDVFADVPDA